MTFLISTSEFYLSPDPLTTRDPSTQPALNLISHNILTKLKNIGPARIRDLRRPHDTNLQILSHIPVDVSPSTCRRLNDTLASQIHFHPDRFAALALLSTWDPKEAAAELVRCVARKKCVGGMLVFGAEGMQGMQGNGKVWDREMDAVWSVAERFNVPVALRVMFPTRGQVNTQYESFFPPNSPVLHSLVTNLHSAHTASPFQVLALYTAGIFDRFPKLKILLSSNGHSIPTLLPKISALLQANPSIPPG
ncbi:hypothetical protein B0J11DRAFT_256900 [Dendryphion nanum]|uniref:Amidohydrolase-related domain-containing protein n=1 Tax=Dendryphion nanum TaxID=256645 RepID=A0A9P9E3Z1_9PLEO|nr:hypothetical protein B0J11DRAFT_256900 [Dendryphion nanum]